MKIAPPKEFVLAAALDGLVDRFIWVFPTWDSKGPKHRQNRALVQRMVQGGLGKTPCHEMHKNMICICISLYIYNYVYIYIDVYMYIYIDVYIYMIYVCIYV